jgi:hypothetical protein
VNFAAEIHDFLVFCRNIGCPQCRLWWDSYELRAAHYKSPQHALVIWEIKNHHVRASQSMGFYNLKVEFFVT